MIDVVIVGASWATRRHPVTVTLADSLDPARFRPRIVPYPGADAAGRMALVDNIRQSSGPVVVAGYAQGAAIVGDIAAGIGTCTGSGEDTDIVCCALIADPFRPEGQVLGQDPGGFGMLGQRSIAGIPAYFVAAKGDLTTALISDETLGLSSEIFDYLTLRNEMEMMSWSRRFIDAYLRQILCQYPFARRQWFGRGYALDHASGRMLVARHVDDYIHCSHVVSLATAINRETFRVAPGDPSRN